MEPGEVSHDQFLLVICPGCNEPLFPPREQGGSKVACPACGAAVDVPQTDDQPRPQPEVPKEYGIHDADFVARPVKYLRLNCPICNTMLYAEPRQVGQLISCPDCYTKVKVRRGGESPKPDKPRPEKPGGYGVLDDGQQSKLAAENYFLFVCPTCNARLHPRRDMAGKKVRCPDCKEVLLVPQPPDRKEPWRPPAVEAYGLEQEGSEGKRLGPEHYLSFACPRCQTPLRALRERVGETVVCHDCGTRLRVPAPRSPHLPR